MEKLLPKLRFPEFSGEWEEKKLNKFAALNPKNTLLPNSFIYIDLESVTNGLLVKENIINKIDAPSRAQRILSKEDILFQTVRPYQKNNLFFDKVGEYVASTGYAQIRTKNNSQFLFQFLHTEKFVSNVMLKCTGTSYPAINSADLSEIEISYPTLPEQTKIANFLTDVDKKLTALKQKKTLLEQYKKGVMQKIFSQELRFKEDNGHDFPNWEEKKLGDLVTLMQSGISRMLSDTDIGLPIIRSNNLQNGKINVTDIKYWYEIDDQGANLDNYVLYEGDLLVNFINSIAQIGKVAIFSDIMKRKTIFTTNLMRLRFNNNVSSYFMLNYFHLKKYEDFIQTITKPAVNQASFTTKDFKDFIVDLPSLPEQTKITNFLSAIDEKINHCQGQIEKTQVWKKGLLQQMFV